jgi:hypothetical protein
LIYKIIIFFDDKRSISNNTFSNLELSSSTPFIDFHYGSSTADYTSRIIENTSGTLEVSGALKVDGAISSPTLTTMQSNFQAGCSTIASAITAKGVSTASNASPSTMATNIGNITLNSATEILKRRSGGVISESYTVTAFGVYLAEAIAFSSMSAAGYAVSTITISGNYSEILNDKIVCGEDGNSYNSWKRIIIKAYPGCVITCYSYANYYASTGIQIEKLN